MARRAASTAPVTAASRAGLEALAEPASCTSDDTTADHTCRAQSTWVLTLGSVDSLGAA